MTASPGSAFRLPPLSLLEDAEPGDVPSDRDAIYAQADLLVKTLADYKITGRITEVHPGPVITMYEYVPAPGTRINKVAALADDLAMSLSAQRVRIVAPIPGKGAIGIEVPNESREKVYFKEIVADKAFHKAKSTLTLAMGKNIFGAPVAMDLARMPHLLVAGATGAGRNVSINAMICSLLMTNSPEQVRMIMVAPEFLELSAYNDIPHLLLPVVTNPRDAIVALRWAVNEMERRYQVLADKGEGDIHSHNEKVDRLPKITRRAGRDSPKEAGVTGSLPGRLPHIVVLVNELADLMMVASKEVETSLARLAQKARAAGIHVILATQRPSVDVITGLIKANFPSRVSLRVGSRQDSRTILGCRGAESLLGTGDMLVLDRGDVLKRLHGAFISDAEIQRIVDWHREQGRPTYDMNILEPSGNDEVTASKPGENPDVMYHRAVALVTEFRQVYISMVQQRLGVGHGRATHMVERMEREGLVGAPEGVLGVARPREE